MMSLAIIHFYKNHTLQQQKQKIYSENTTAEAYVHAYYVQIKSLSKYYSIDKSFKSFLCIGKL